MAGLPFDFYEIKAVLWSENSIFYLELIKLYQLSKHFVDIFSSSLAREGGKTSGRRRRKRIVRSNQKQARHSLLQRERQHPK